MQQIIEIFALGAVGFWIALLVLTIAVIAALETDSFGWLTLTTVGLVMLALPTASHVSMVVILELAGAYILVGGVWSIYKWWRHTNKVVDEARRLQQQYPDSFNNRQYTWRINPTNNKAKITAWIAYWPWSLLWALTHDIFNTIYDCLVGVYEKITLKAQARLNALAPTTTTVRTPVHREQ
jgi:hypothetical protein